MGLFRAKSVVILAALTLINGCAFLQVKREVLENTFTSSLPKFTLVATDDFKYLGQVKDHGTGDSISGDVKLDRHYDYYAFGQIEGDVIKKSIAIKFFQTSGRFISDLYSNVKKTITKGTTKIGSKSFIHYSKIVYPSVGHKLIRYLADEGYRMPCGLYTEYGRVMSADADLLVTVIYYESLDDSGLACHDWGGIDQLSEEQLSYFNEYKKRSVASFDLSFQ